ncbi:MAG: heparinase II/III family protein [Victivallales bacterium]|nr:heparinase II/III family protein [Victivallales bacterium]
MKNSILLLMCILSAISGAVPLTAFEKELLERPAAEFRNEVYPPTIARAFDVTRNGCPVCGDGIKKHGLYAWRFDYRKPFKLQCPECKSVFPDNDFEAYWKSGFKDKSLLTGKYVDDGRGWRPAPGQPKFWFVAYYHYRRFYKDKVYLQLARAYVRTGEPGFAIRCIAMLDKYAEQYDQYDYNKQCRYAEEVDPNYQGRILDHIQMTFVVNDFVECYNAVKPFLEAGTCPELQTLTGRDNHSILTNIEENLLRGMANDIMSMNGRIHGNFGMDQRGLLNIAKALKDPGMASWVTDYREKYDLATVPLDYAIYNNIFTDGAPLESPGYNMLWVNNIMQLFILLMENGIDEFARHPSSRHLFNYFSELNLSEMFATSSGDSSNMRERGCYRASVETHRALFDAYPSPLNARFLLMVDPKNPKEKQLNEMADWNYGYANKLLSSYGFAALQNGNREAPTVAMLLFHRYIGHRHADALHFEIFAEGSPMMPDFGYPDSASADDPERAPFYENTVVHNTVVVDGKKQSHSRGRILRFDTGTFVQQMVAEAPSAYGIPLYRRHIMTIEVASGKTIFLDVFRVRGGSQHDWFMHGDGESFATEIPLVEQDGGTLAGKDVPYGTFYDDPKIQAMFEKTMGRSFSGYRGSGYQFLTKVRHGKTVFGKPIVLPAETRGFPEVKPGAALKVYPLSEGEELLLSEGMPPRTQRNPQKHVVFVTRRRVGKDLSSTFATLYETTCDERRELEIEGIAMLPAPEDACAVKVVFKTGRTLYLFNANGSSAFDCDGVAFRGESGALLLDAANGQGRCFVTGGGSLSYQGRVVLEAADDFTATIASVNLAQESITFNRDVPTAYLGRFVRIGDYAYRCGKIEGKTITLYRQSTIQGRVRFEGTEASTSGVFVPAPYLAAAGMSLYQGEDKATYVARLLDVSTVRNKTSFKTDVPIKPGEYWISECGPGEKAVFPGCASVDFPLK